MTSPWATELSEDVNTTDMCTAVSSCFSDNFAGTGQFTLENRNSAFALQTMDHIAKLENRLNRLKANSEPSAKDMIKNLHWANEAQAQRLVSADNEARVYISSENQVLQASALQKKLLPASIALTEEELISLIRSDELAKVVQDLQENSENIVNVDLVDRGKVSVEENVESCKK